MAGNQIGATKSSKGVRAPSQAGQERKSVSARLELGEITTAEAFELTREAALTSLERAMQCRSGLERKLQQRGYPSEIVGQVLNRLTLVGLIDDVEYAQAVTRARLERGLAKRAIAAELQRKGVGVHALGEALAQVEDGQQLAAAEQIAAKTVNRCHGLAAEVVARRAFGAVSRRGYSLEIATTAVSRALAANTPWFPSVVSRPRHKVTRYGSNRANQASTSSGAAGSAAERFSGPLGVIRMSSSIRTPMPRNSGGTVKSSALK